MSLPATSACSSAGSGRRPSITTVTAVPGTGGPPKRARNSPDGSAIPTMPSSRSSKQPTSSAGAEAVLDAADHAQRRVLVALEGQHDVDEVLQHPRAGDRAVLGHVPDQHHRQPALLGQRRSSATVTARTCVTPPGAPSAVSVDMVCTESTTSSCGATASMWRDDRRQVGLGGQVQLVVHGAGALGAQPDLPRRLLAGDVEDRARSRRPCAATSSSSVDLPTPGSPASSTTAPGTSPPPSTRSSSATPVGRARRGVELDLGDPPGRATTAPPPRPCARPRRAATCSSVPHAWHDGQRPTHCAVCCPHSAQR